MKIVFITLLLTALPFSAFAADSVETLGAEPQHDEMSWPQIRAAVDHCFSGWNLTFDVSGGVEQREYQGDGDWESRTAPFAEAKLTIPLYGAKKRREEQREHTRQLESLADMLAEVESGRAQLEVKREMATVLQKALIEDGAVGIERYYKIREEITVLEARIRAQERKLRAWVKLCGEL